MKIASHSSNERARLASLESYELMDSEPNHEYDELTELIANICQTPIALITLIGEDRQWFKSRYGTDIQETHRDIAFCSHTILQPEKILIVADATKDERFFDNPMVIGDNKVIFYAGVSLVNNQGYALGSMCVLSHEKRELTEFQINALRVFGKQVVNQMELSRKVQEVQSSNEALLESYAFIEKFAERAAHDIRNPLSNIILTAQALRAMLIKRGEDRSIRLVEIMLEAGKNLTSYVNELLRYSKSPSILQLQHEEFELVYTLKKTLNLIDIPNHCNIDLPGGPAYLNCSRIALEQIFLNLITNAVRYNDKPQPKILVSFAEDGQQYYFQVKDNGKGIAAEHQLKIFEDGFTVAEPDRYNKKGNGIGMNIVKSLIDKMGGKITLSSEIGIGTTFYLSIPKEKAS